MGISNLNCTPLSLSQRASFPHVDLPLPLNGLLWVQSVSLFYCAVNGQLVTRLWRQRSIRSITFTCAGKVLQLLELKTGMLPRLRLFTGLQLTWRASGFRGC